MGIFEVLSLLGGLALFLFGMNLMGQALEKAAGSKLKNLLAKLTANPVRGLLLGAAVTAVIQSSSATTVMVVGFVNSGIMQLRQAIGLIMGANIGTTVTAWLLSLTGLQSSNTFVRLLKPSSFTPVLALIGILLYMAGKREKKKDAGMALLGFAVLMYGMESMAAAVKPLAEVPQFTNMLTLFSNPVFGVLAGAALTAVIQSSSASVGILQALSVTGTVTFGSAIPIILGQNIGTCVTALISSVGTNRNAKRAAMVHLYFNIIGTVTLLAAFYGLNALLHFSFITNYITPLGIAIVHSSFNLLCTLLLLPFTRQLEKLVCITVRDNGKKDEHLELLDERLFSTPAVAVERARAVTCRMAETVRNNLLLAIALLGNYDEKESRYIEETENVIDEYEDKLGSYLVKLSSKALSAGDSEEISLLLHDIGDFERIADHAVNILDSAREIQEKELIFSEDAKEELRILTDAVIEIVNLAVNAFIQQDKSLAALVEPLEQVVDDLKMQLRDRHIQRLQAGQCTVALGFVYSDLLTNFERVSDHCSNIAVFQLEQAGTDYDTHAYLNKVKSGGSSDFSEHFREYRQKYLLP
ncbi:MAG: Na/Pi cotransporter family protein [Clostridiaceae bacterium]|nr:Na/Pi cotransporter family protein [Clostridiaceae bacterium]